MAVSHSFRTAQQVQYCISDVPQHSAVLLPYTTRHQFHSKDNVGTDHGPQVSITHLIGSSSQYHPITAFTGSAFTSRAPHIMSRQSQAAAKKNHLAIPVFDDILRGADGAVLHNILDLKTGVWCLDIGGNSMVSGCMDGSCITWDIATGKRLGTLSSAHSHNPATAVQVRSRTRQLKGMRPVIDPALV